MLLAASVSVTVTSQLTHLPSDQGIWVTPSGRFPSDLTNPCGSLTAGILARFMARHIMSFRKLWRPILPELLLQARPRVPRTLTDAPKFRSGVHTDWCQNVGRLQP